MAIIAIKKNGRTKYFKGYNTKTGKPVFTTTKALARQRPEGYYITSELDQLKFYHKKEFPELEEAYITGI